MSRMDEFVNKKRGMLFIPFITAGDPTEDATIELAAMLQSAGASALELGIPYSDPLADGPVIQKASQRALKHGMTLAGALRLCGRIREHGVTIPLIVFTYINPLIQLGSKTFFQLAQENQVDGLLVPDLPFEESRELAQACSMHHICLISLVAPTTSDKRLKAIAGSAQGFLYCVSSLGVTGVRKQFHPSVFPFLDRVRTVTDLPTAVGFGISTSAQVDALRSHADGFIVGSAIVSLIGERAERLSDRRTCSEAAAQIKRILEERLLGQAVGNR
ncbi:tryptophan synthase subunit alpha [Sporolactobacillus vineae]|uniref:tryptophan synthase subunit alpha n=1 Tax=Sporolactobacillus vineae TaxID=444463 RepID=UPI000287FF0B|nr:tryptophan synthase subunit alpha [Sporolactobacillus vineae]